MEDKEHKQTSSSAAADVVVKAAEAAKQIVDSASAVAAAEVVRTAALAAKQAAEQADEKTINSISEALRKVFGENERAGKFIDVSRIPLICQNINEIHARLTDMAESMKENNENYINKDMFWPIKTLVYGATGIILTGVISALVYLVVQTQ